MQWNDCEVWAKAPRCDKCDKKIFGTQVAVDIFYHGSKDARCPECEKKE